MLCKAGFNTIAWNTYGVRRTHNTFESRQSRHSLPHTHGVVANITGSNSFVLTFVCIRRVFPLNLIALQWLAVGQRESLQGVAFGILQFDPQVLQGGIPGGHGQDFHRLEVAQPPQPRLRRPQLGCVGQVAGMQGKLAPDDAPSET